MKIGPWSQALTKIMSMVIVKVADTGRFKYASFPDGPCQSSGAREAYVLEILDRRTLLAFSSYVNARLQNTGICN